MSASPPPSEMHLKAAVTSYVVCVMCNFESSEQYLSAKCGISEPPTVSSVIYTIGKCLTLEICYLGKWYTLEMKCIQYFDNFDFSSILWGTNP